jgi:hypothetical protein
MIPIVAASKKPWNRTLATCRLSILGPSDRQPENNPLPLRVCSPCLNLIRFQIRAAFWMNTKGFFYMTI